MKAPSRKEIMEHLSPWLEQQMKTLLRPVEALWQPTDFLPDLASESGHDDLKALQEEARALPNDVVSVLVGDTVTEEALPTYSNWLACLEGVSEAGAASQNPWAVWNRAWCGEENRHGDVLSRYLVLSGRVNMREVDVVIMGVYRSLKLVLHVVVRLAWPPNAFGHLGIGNRFDNNCLLDKAVEEFAAGARCPSVEAKGEFIKVVVKVLSADCALVRSQQPSLDQ